MIFSVWFDLVPLRPIWNSLNCVFPLIQSSENHAWVLLIYMSTLFYLKLQDRNPPSRIAQTVACESNYEERVWCHFTQGTKNIYTYDHRTYQISVWSNTSWVRSSRASYSSNHTFLTVQDHLKLVQSTITHFLRWFLWSHENNHVALRIFKSKQMKLGHPAYWEA